MKLIDLTFPTPEENLACDEALLLRAEDGGPGRILRFWESPDPFVVLGYANKLKQNVHEQYCREHGIPVLRRISGGGTVLQGPGSLNFALILEIDASDHFQNVSRTTDYIMNRHKNILERHLGTVITVKGISDLASNDLKFSGNAQRRMRRHVLFHGTFLYNFSIPVLESVLRLPPLQPDYRRQRSHRDFLCNLKADAGQIKSALIEEWKADDVLTELPGEIIRELAAGKYKDAAWNEKY